MRPELRNDHVAFFAENESSVRYYCRRLPALLSSASGATILDAAGRSYIDLMSACGALNYGHNHPHLKKAAIDYITADGLSAALDFHTEAKLRFMSSFRDKILAPRGLSYRMQFTGPTGANCVEAAIKLARKVTGRHGIAAFTNAFHGVSSGALAATGSRVARSSGGRTLDPVVRLPFEGYCGAGSRDLSRFEAMVVDASGGIDPVAAIVVEVVQGEGGLNVASPRWLAALSETAKRIGALLIVDEIQTGCGRTGSFFAFERAGIVPDMVCLAKSIGGYGYPMSLLLLKPELDVWAPGEHNGTFRGNSIAFATGAAALDLWDDDFVDGVRTRSDSLRLWCVGLAAEYPEHLRHKGLGMMQGVQFAAAEHAAEVADRAVAAGILVECCGPNDEVLKVMAPLNIELDLFQKALAVLRTIVVSVIEVTVSPPLQRDEPVSDSHDHGGDPVAGTEFPHRVPHMEFDGFLGDR
ncbi:diaminobutyrate--2-oxoglutarate transaminase [Bradyrhizobium sp. USDA 3650]